MRRSRKELSRSTAYERLPAVLYRTLYVNISILCISFQYRRRTGYYELDVLIQSLNLIYQVLCFTRSLLLFIMALVHHHCFTSPLRIYRYSHVSQKCLKFFLDSICIGNVSKFYSRKPQFPSIWQFLANEQSQTKRPSINEPTQTTNHSLLQLRPGYTRM